MSQQNKPTLFEHLKPFIFGGISGCVGATLIMPLDTWKVRIQVKGEDKGLHKGQNVKVKPMDVGRELFKADGIRGFYKGLGSALLRQLTYATTRLGLYKAYADHIKATHQRDMTFGEKVVASSVAGFFGALVGNPADVCLVRFQSDTSLPINERRNYKNVGDALMRVIKEEGLITLWRGSTPTILRAMSLNLSQLTTYDEIKERSMRFNNRTKETNADRLMASTLAGIATSVFSLPFDNVKTKLQKMKQTADGTYAYKGVSDCLAKTVQREGVVGLWVGLPVYYVRVAPMSMIILLVQDFLHSITSKH